MITQLLAKHPTRPLINQSNSRPANLRILRHLRSLQPNIRRRQTRPNSQLTSQHPARRRGLRFINPKILHSVNTRPSLIAIARSHGLAITSQNPIRNSPTHGRVRRHVRIKTPQGVRLNPLQRQSIYRQCKYNHKSKPKSTTSIANSRPSRDAHVQNNHRASLANT